MTQNEFQKKYHDYVVHSEDEAKVEELTVNLLGIEGDKAVAVDFGWSWGLMLESAHKGLDELCGWKLPKAE